MTNEPITRGLRAMCGHDSRSVDGCLTCEAADRIENPCRALSQPSGEDGPIFYVGRVFDCNAGEDRGEIEPTLPAALIGKRVRLVPVDAAAPPQEAKGDDFDAFVRNEGPEFAAAVDARYNELTADDRSGEVEDLVHRLIDAAFGDGADGADDYSENVKTLRAALIRQLAAAGPAVAIADLVKICDFADEVGSPVVRVSSIRNVIRWNVTNHPAALSAGAHQEGGR